MALVLVLSLMLVLGVTSATVIEAVQGETTRSAQAVTKDAAYQAAEAGIQDYIAKLLSDNSYYLHWVHPGEATRRATDGTLIAHGAAWTKGLTWTYASNKNQWLASGTGYEYDLEVTAPSATSSQVKIISTGRPTGDVNRRNWRTIETNIRPSSVSDFQMLSAADISYGATATTYGKIYAGKDSGGTAHSITHSGTAYGDLEAENRVTGGVTLMNGAKIYDKQTNPTIRTPVPTAVVFSDFLSSLGDIQRASQNGGIYLNDATADAWQLTFQSTGNVLVQKCTKSKDVNNVYQPVAQLVPTCAAATSYPVPTNGAIYAVQTAIISTSTTASSIKGRVTVASNNDVVVGNNITYVLGGDDVLGLVATNNILVAQWCPNNLTWWAATIAETGQFKSYVNDGSHGTMNFYGSTATYGGGSMSMFTTRNYNYDSNLLFLVPPWFPKVGDAYTAALTREIPASP